MSHPIASLLRLRRVASCLGLVAAALLFACGPRAAPPQPGQAGALSTALRRQLCAARCGGPHASIRVFRDAGREIGVLRLDGDLGRCSHPPSTYFDPRGRELAIIPFKPVVVGSPEHRRIQAIHERHTRGLRAAETVSCRP